MTPLLITTLSGIRLGLITISHSSILDDHVLCSCEPGKPCSYKNRGYCYLVGGPLAKSCAGATKGSSAYVGYWTRDEEICQRDDGKRWKYDGCIIKYKLQSEESTGCLLTVQDIFPMKLSPMLISVNYFHSIVCEKEIKILTVCDYLQSNSNLIVRVLRGY